MGDETFRDLERRYFRERERLGLPPVVELPTGHIFLSYKWKPFQWNWIMMSDNVIEMSMKMEGTPCSTS